MRLTPLVVAVTMLVTLSVPAQTVQADQRRGQGGRGQAASRVAPRGQAPRSVAPGPRSVAPGPRASAQRTPPRYVGPPRGVAVPRATAPYRSYGYARPYPAARAYSYARPSYGRSYAYARPYYSGRSYYYGRPYYYGHPYYSFRPRVSIGFGLWAGFPVAYPYFGVSVGYGYPYASPYPYAYPVPVPYPTYGYPAPAASVGVTPGAATYGGVSFEITPADAAVYVDGAYVGVVSNFTPNAPPLPLTPGAHRVEVQAPGYETMVFDVNVIAGQVIPFRGTMQAAPPY